jgi:hypothetical protein
MLPARMQTVKMLENPAGCRRSDLMQRRMTL